jgi:hypothetical protein
MSLGPSKLENFKTPTIDKIQYVFKKTIGGYFDRPFFYLFYIMLTGTVVALFFNHYFPVLFYVLLAVFGVNEFIKKNKLTK